MRATPILSTLPAMVILFARPGGRLRRIAAVTVLAGAAMRPALAQIAMVDATATAGVTFLHQPNTTMYAGLQEWMAGGLAVADFNRDGWPDIYWASGGGTSAAPQPDHLFINQGDGTFIDEAASWGIAAVHAANGACAGDFDDNGWPDIYVTSFGSATNNQGQVGKNRLYRNNGDGTFTEVAASAGVNFTAQTIPNGYGCAFGDYDLDGDLDLCVLAWVDAANGNRLFRNNGDGTFSDVTGSAIVFPATFWAFQPTFADLDGDGWPELLCAADFSTSRYYRNNGDGTFTDYTTASGTGLDQNGMGQCVGDFNGDGLLDWYVTSIFSDKPNPLSGEGNKLYLNLGDHHYAEAATIAEVADGGWGWGAIAVDLDNDRLLDIVEVNGRPGSAEYDGEQEYVWRNLGDGTFEDVTLACGLTAAAEGKSVSSLDYDRDGRMDVAIGFNGNYTGAWSPGAENRLYRNVSTGGAWLHLTFDTQNNPRIAPMGFGVRVEATVGVNTFVQHVDSGPNYLGTSEVCAHFGLGGASFVDKIVVKWPRGYQSTLFNVPVNQAITVVSPSLCNLDGLGEVDGGDLGLLLGAWGELGTTSDRKADLNADGVVDGADLGVMLGSWGVE